MRVMLLLATILLTPLARAAELDGPLIRHAFLDRARHDPGQSVQLRVVLNNRTVRVWTGSVSVALSHLGRAEGAAQNQTVTNLTPNDSLTLTFNVQPPAHDEAGYLASITASGGGVITDTALRGIDVSRDWTAYPRLAFLADFGPSVDTADTLASLDEWGVNGLQYYDVVPKHHVPDGSVGASSWVNLANAPVSATTVNAYVAGARTHGMTSFAYNLWNGGFPNFDADNSGVQLRWGLFNRACSTGNPCTAGDLDNTPANPRATPAPPDGALFPTSWAARALLLFDPGNLGWRDYHLRRMANFLSAYDFDGYQIDTLGAPTGPRWDFAGRPRDLEADLVGYTNAAKATTGRRVVLNNVSRWGEQPSVITRLANVAAQAHTDAHYSELWPWDVPYYPSLNGATNGMRQHTTKGLLIPSYMQTTYAQGPGGSRYGCDPLTDATCFVSEPGARLATAQVLASGAWHVAVADKDKWLTNIFVPGPMLGLKPLTMRALIDYAQFGVAYQELLRLAVDAPQPSAILSGATGSTTGAAGAVYMIPKSSQGRQLLHLLNLTGVSSNTFNDLDATHEAPSVLGAVGVRLYYAGVLPTDGASLWWASPDTDRGAAHAVSYTAGSNALGSYVDFTLPSLRYWTMIWLDTQAVSADGHGLLATQPLRAADRARASDGLGVSADGATLTGACCGRAARYRRVDFGTGVTSVSLLARSPAGGRVEWRLDAADGPLAAAASVPASAGPITVTAPVSGASGVHTLWLVFPDRAVELVSQQFQ